ncbi:MAG: U32 family peptidase [Chitinophagaceae bacterium]|nr:U32 family peptidase [Chitinophagaceae bacterium]
MSPAGSFESLQAALQGGADAVYFGIEQLNMRARSSNNFGIDDLARIHEICTLAGVRAYLTLNTILYDHDLALMKRILNAAKEYKIDAVIASDQAVLNYTKKIGLPLHISTQANVSNVESVEFFSNFADTIVLARELSLGQVKAIVDQIKRNEITGPSGEQLRIEVFAHGALCMAVSGKCYLSLHSHFASANRGACIQNCRRSYVVTDKEEGIELEIDNEYIMSSKDLCTIDFLDTLLDTGVRILKIEGRGRSADYVYTTTKCYREAIDAIANGTYHPEKARAWKDELATVFNRGFWGGYFLGKEMGEWSDVYGSKATLKKIYLGKGINYFSKPAVAEFLLETDVLEVGHHIMITGPTTGIVQVVVEELRLGGKPVQQVKKGDYFSIKIPATIRPSDKLYKVLPSDVPDHSASK